MLTLHRRLRTPPITPDFIPTHQPLCPGVQKEHRRGPKVEVHLEDGLDGRPAAETVAFALDGKDYAIDLSTGNT